MGCVCVFAGAHPGQHETSEISGESHLLGPELARIGDKRVADGGRLLDDHGMGRVRDDHDGDAGAQRAAGIPRRPRHGRAGRGSAGCRAPAPCRRRSRASRGVRSPAMRCAASTSGCQPVEPDAGVAARREEHELHRLDPLVVRRAGGRRSAGSRRARPAGSGCARHWRRSGRRREPDRAAAVASIRATRLPKAWPTTKAGPLPSCSITAAMSAARSSSVDALPGSGALADAARLRPQHAKAGRGEPLGDRVEVRRRRGRATAAARSQGLCLGPELRGGRRRVTMTEGMAQRRSWNATSAPSMIAPPRACSGVMHLAEQRRAQDRRQQRLEIHDQRAAERADAVDRHEQRQHRDGDGDADHDQGEPAGGGLRRVPVPGARAKQRRRSTVEETQRVPGRSAANRRRAAARG